MGNLVPFPASHGPMTLMRAVSELEVEEQEVVRRRWGLGRPLQSDEEVAEQLGLDVEVVWDLHDRALNTLGFLWLTESLLPAFLPGSEAA